MREGGASIPQENLGDDMSCHTTEKTRLGLRINACTFRGIKYGVPCLLETLLQHRARASFFFSIGPDNTGLYLWRYLNPINIINSFKARSPSLMYWDALLTGPPWPRGLIGPRCREHIKAVADSDMEVGVQSWDYYNYRFRLHRLPLERIASEQKLANQMMEDITGRPVLATASPGWSADQNILLARENYNYLYASDCRFHLAFLPEVRHRTHKVPQIPVTLPTLEELVRSGMISAKYFPEIIVEQIKPCRLNVLAISAEMEGLAFRDVFDILLGKLCSKDIIPTTLGSLLPEKPDILPVSLISKYRPSENKTGDYVYFS